VLSPCDAGWSIVMPSRVARRAGSTVGSRRGQLGVLTSERPWYTHFGQLYSFPSTGRGRSRRGVRYLRHRTSVTG